MTQLNNTSSLSLDGVSVVYSTKGQEHLAVKDVSFDVEPGEFVVLLGPSGCGKSTLLYLMAGLRMPSEGTVTYRGDSITGPSPERGLLFQDYALFPWMTVRRNITIGPEARGVGKAEREAAAEHYIDLVGLSGFADRYPRELSGGMRQRCALARLMANKASVLLMDEPLAAIDAQMRVVLQDEVASLLWNETNEDGTRKSVVWVTHSIEEAVYLADRVVVMGTRPGHLKEIVPIDLPRPREESIRDTPRFQELTRYLWQSIRGEVRSQLDSNA